MEAKPNKLIPVTSAFELLRSMTRIRMVEEEIARRYKEQKMRCPVHLSIGQEAAAVGVCAALIQSDWVFSGHRNHAHYMAKGGNLRAMIAEIYGKASGCCGGRGGSMHLTDLKAGFIGATPIVGSTVPIATGAALTAQSEGKARAVVVFLGDGAMETGVVNESLNFAAVRRLPILFVCENNLYSVYSPLDVRQPKGRCLSDLAKGHGVSSYKANGNDVIEVYSTTLRILSKLRDGGGPAFMELPTYRWREHCGPNYDNDIGYRTEDEFQEWKKQDPLLVLRNNTSEQLSANDVRKIRTEVDEAFEAAISDIFPEAASAELYVYSNEAKIEEAPKERNREITYAEAIREAQDLCLGRHKNTYLMGLGVPDPKGIFGTTTDLQKLYGPQRVFDIPLAENAMTGVAIGSAITGMRPILTHQRLDFALVSIDQIVNQAAKWHYMFNGKMNVPLVIRMIIGRGWGQGPQHSQSLHAWFAHIPGLKVVMPTTAYDAKGMLISAVEDDSPVLFLEHRWLHNTTSMVPSCSYKVPLSKAEIVKAGRDVTLIGVSYMTIECLQASKELSALGIEAEVIDLKSIQPLDTKTILASIKKTKRVAVVDHATGTCGISSEILALACECLGKELRSNPKRICLPAHPAPTSFSLAANYYPTSKDIAADICAMLGVEYIGDRSYAPNSFRDQPNPDFVGPF